ncbi:MAG: endolytic transglycosylase MltG [Sediminibacterium sp.]
MKKIGTILILLMVVASIVTTWSIFSPITNFSGAQQSFTVDQSIVKKGAVIKYLNENGMIKNGLGLWILSKVIPNWEVVRPGKYQLKQGQTAWQIARMLKNGRVAEVKLVINKLRTKEDFAQLIGNQFSTDSTTVMQFITSNDSLQPFGVDTSTFYAMIIQDTYQFYWDTPFKQILTKLKSYQEKFWDHIDRRNKLQSKHLTDIEAYTLASIVDEETNVVSDKYKIASVYINRLAKDMPLQACPTIKYALKDFTITRIYEKYLLSPSPYNTYRKKGLPPGPICTPLPATIDIVLNAPNTNYLYFVAKSDFSGMHHFSPTYEEHNKYAIEYQKALDIYMAKKNQTP